MYRSALSLSTLIAYEWSPSCPGRFNLGTHCVIGWMCKGADLEGVEKGKFLTLAEIEYRFLVLPACNQSLNRLCYP
jgi:hypothetical protein